MKIQNKIYNLYIYKWSHIENRVRKYAGFGDSFFLIKKDLLKFGISGVKIQTCDFWFRLRFRSEEDLNLFKLSAKIHIMPAAQLGRSPIFRYE